MSNDDLYAGILSPNGNAFEKLEVRQGSPLDYVCKKIRSAVTSAQPVYQAIEETVPVDQPEPRKSSGFQERRDGVQLMITVQLRFLHLVALLLTLKFCFAIKHERDSQSRCPH